MDPVETTPTKPIDYAALSAAYGSLLGALLLAAGRREDTDPLRAAEVVPLGVATFALAKTVSKEKVETWMREPFVDEQPDGERRPKGRRLRYAIGELLTCSRCTGAWSALALVGLRATYPRESRIVNAVLGATALNDFLQAGFTWTCARSDAACALAEAAQSEDDSGPAAIEALRRQQRA